MKRTKSHFKDPNRRSNRFKPTWVKRSELVREKQAGERSFETRTQ